MAKTLIMPWVPCTHKPYCRGTWQEMGEETCSWCAGSGRDTSSNLWHAKCKNPRCINGKVTYCRTKKCPTCGGTRRVWQN